MAVAGGPHLPHADGVWQLCSARPSLRSRWAQSLIGICAVCGAIDPTPPSASPQACSHCHVESSPLRTEAMDRRTADRCLALLADARDSIHTLDITGGAPELSPQFRWVPAGV